MGVETGNQADETWAVLVLIQNNTSFRAEGTNQTKGCYRGRKPVSMLLVRLEGKICKRKGYLKE